MSHLPAFRSVTSCPVVILLLMMCAGSPARAQESGLAFLTIGTDAESMALGGAGTAFASGPYATYWNPAGLMAGTDPAIGLSHHIWIEDVRTYAFAGSFPLGAKTSVGAFITATGAGDIEAREVPGEATGKFGAQFVSAGASLSRILGNLRVGATVKFLSERIHTDSAEGVAFDFGAQTEFSDGAVRLGAAVMNIGSMEELAAQTTELPLVVRGGVQVFPFRVLTDLDGALLLNTSLILEASRNDLLDQNQVHLGLSAEVLETVTARVGYITNDELRDFTTGVGFEISSLVFDYAVIPFESGFGGPAHILTLTYGW